MTVHAHTSGDDALAKTRAGKSTSSPASITLHADGPQTACTPKEIAFLTTSTVNDRLRQST